MVVFGAAEMRRSGARFQFEICSIFGQNRCGLAASAAKCCLDGTSNALPCITDNDEFLLRGCFPIVRRRATEPNLASASYATISNGVNSVTFETSGCAG
jgi:hypothetical protein